MIPTAMTTLTTMTATTTCHNGDVISVHQALNNEAHYVRIERPSTAKEYMQ